MDIEEQDAQDRARKKSPANKHSYFLRAKMPRSMGFHVGDHEERRASSPSSISCKPFLSSRGLKSLSEECSIQTEEEDLANCLVMLSNNKSLGKDREVAIEKGMFQCKACKKVFNSHQALGGHRASHKKVKGCFASKLDGLKKEDEDEEINEQEPVPSELTESTRKRVKMHECSVCHRVFSSGQALGGHKRCHWLTTSSSDNAFIPNFQYHDHHTAQQLCNNPTILITKHDSHQLDLNLNLPPPPPPQHDHDINKTSTRLCLHNGPNHNQQKVDKEEIDKNNENGFGMKLRKLSDPRDVNMDGGWLQMGIASNSTEMRDQVKMN